MQLFDHCVKRWTTTNDCQKARLNSQVQLIDKTKVKTLV